MWGFFSKNLDQSPVSPHWARVRFDCKHLIEADENKKESSASVAGSVFSRGVQYAADAAVRHG